MAYRVCRIGPATGLEWTGMSRPILCVTMQLHCRPGCASPTSRESTFLENSVSGWKIVGS